MKKLLFLLGIICFTPTVSLAEDKVYKDTSYLILYNFSWDTVIHIARTARKKFVGAKLSTGEIIEKETPAQLAKPIVNFETVSIMVDVGALSVTAEWCGLDWQNNYLLSMQGLRATKLFTESQMAYFGLVHGVTMSYVGDELNENKCSEERKEQIRKILNGNK